MKGIVGGPSTLHRNGGHGGWIPTIGLSSMALAGTIIFSPKLEFETLAWGISFSCLVPDFHY